MIRFRLLTTVVLVFLASFMLGGCETWHGDEEVDTEPEEGSSKGPGLFTGTKGGIIICIGGKTGVSLCDDTVE
jgi:hypothetical protein